jgi:hypothetical protein
MTLIDEVTMERMEEYNTGNKSRRVNSHEEVIYKYCQASRYGKQ